MYVINDLTLTTQIYIYIHLEISYICIWKQRKWPAGFTGGNILILVRRLHRRPVVYWSMGALLNTPLPWDPASPPRSCVILAQVAGKPGDRHPLACPGDKLARFSQGLSGSHLHGWIYKKKNESLIITGKVSCNCLWVLQKKNKNVIYLWKQPKTPNAIH